MIEDVDHRKSEDAAGRPKNQAVWIGGRELKAVGRTPGTSGRSGPGRRAEASSRGECASLATGQQTQRQPVREGRRRDVWETLDGGRGTEAEARAVRGGGGGAETSVITAS